MRTQNAFLVVDVQNDFCPGGLYPVPKGNEVVKLINKLIKYARKNKWLLFASRDWHPKSVFKNNQECTHCVQNTSGAEFHHDLNISNDFIVISKGEDLSDKHYSGFNGDDKNLDELLRIKKVKKIFIAGLATDYCVKKTAIDSAFKGFETYVILDACRAVNKTPNSGIKAIEEMKLNGVKIINSKDLLG